jgi:hypothetical protein
MKQNPTQYEDRQPCRLIQIKRERIARREDRRFLSRMPRRVVIQGVR